MSKRQVEIHPAGLKDLELALLETGQQGEPLTTTSRQLAALLGFFKSISTSHRLLSSNTETNAESRDEF